MVAEKYGPDLYINNFLWHDLDITPRAPGQAMHVYHVTGPRLGVHTCMDDLDPFLCGGQHAVQRATAILLSVFFWLFEGRGLILVTWTQRKPLQKC